jgi:predicted Zn finger-like uncharacterized protein
VQANCPKCANRITIDDARVPDRAFSVKCPKCQTSVRFPGKGAAAAPPAPPPPAAAAPAPAPVEPPRAEPETGPSAEALRAEMLAQVRREMSLGDGARTASGRAVVTLADRTQAGAVALPLTRQGYQVDTVDNADEGSRLIEQGVYDVVIASRAPAPAGKESLYQRLSRLSPDARRRIFLVLVGEDFKTGDGTQAWITMADLVVHPRDLATVDAVLTKTVEERTRLYQVYLDARKRFELSAAVG